MFNDLIGVDAPEGTPLRELSQLLRHDLSRLECINAMTGTRADWLKPISRASRPLCAFTKGSVMYYVDADGARRARPHSKVDARALRVNANR